MKLRAATVIAFFIILLNAQVLIGKSANPIGIDGVQELFYLGLLVWAIWAILVQQKSFGGVRRLDVYVLLLALGPMLYGAVTAWAVYGQPMQYGLLEERRILAVLVYFPIRTMLERNWVSIWQFETMVISAAVVCALLSVGVKVDVVPTLNAIQSSELALRGDRISIGPAAIAISIPIALGRRSQGSLIFSIVATTFLVGTLFVIVQSRQLILASLVASAFVVRGPRAALLILALIVGLYLAFLFLPGLADQVMVLFQLFFEAASQEYLELSWRGLSISASLNGLQQGEIWGHGSLSLLWNDGFHRVIGPYFFLADIGIVGSLFRYGLAGILFYLYWGVVQMRLLRSMPDRKRRVLYGGLVLFLITGMPVGAPLEYRGEIVGLVLGATAYLTSPSGRRLSI